LKALTSIRDSADVALSDLTADSRKVKPGFLFVAVPGTKADGLSFVPQAVANGAAAVMAEKKPDLPAQILTKDVAFISSAQCAPRARARRRQVLSASACHHRRCHRHQRQDLGRRFLAPDLGVVGLPAASIGTVGVVSPKGEIYGSLTTPDPIDLHRTLDRLAGEGVTHLALEASSHGLDQHRLDGVRVSAGGFTNLSRDHLDYHLTTEAYLAAKLRLFTDLVAANGTAVIDVDDAHAGQVVDAAKTRGLRLMTVGAKGRASTSPARPSKASRRSCNSPMPVTTIM